MGYGSDRPVFCGNFEYGATPREIERLFDRYGVIDRIDMKTGFAFVYMKDDRDAEDAIRALDRREFGYRRRRLRVEWAKGDGDVKRREDLRRRQTKPTTTLFVVNFDVENTTERDLERHFEQFGKLTRVQIKRNYAFIQYDEVESATKAVDNCHLSRLAGRTISVEYVAREADGRRIEDDSRSRSPLARRSRSPSYGRERAYSPKRSPRRSPSPAPRRNISPRRSRSPRSRSPLSRSRSLT
ncbi:hypothetical protein WJX84_000557 [Apatococcus fuscideae]|uniref:RRM domain-containing protein n=1 Tax=Apatococcus fuscideae TaxID=2026836 RepID=A0AAW1T4C5_9CHLO